MNEKLNNYLNGVFAPYDGVKSVADLKTDLLSDLQERFQELKAEGKDDETAFEMTVDSIGDIEQTVQEVANLSRSLERQVVTNLSASNLPESDFAGVIAHKAKFAASALRGSDFTGADLTGSTFASSDVREAIFDHANLTDCNLSTNDLTDSNFHKSILERTSISKSGLDGAKFIDVELTDVKLTMTDLRKTVFVRCTFSGVDFKYTDLRGLRFDGQTFIGVKFDKSALNEVSFKDAVLKNVSFLAGFALSKKYYRAIKTICFDGAVMDKLTYAALKGMDADLSKVIVR
ncbi:pentapeptide repeat-containing protein [Paenibacillus sp. HN-1]|uniref:pentapeptide repeat-containing protein n=1 Tax=Paenibacillus TaxID=44249 RepID=UPI001CA85840|nr:MULTISPECIES: pentapeptide repeat-containing protein [Paenibacillus]MBY9079235.1 pentapeptide repeat-containing protein [Paenibacillus sp. CGMCC 1.18879]MBY9086958.1 pentapeptide repeat-containing protein [Paenibacillus sinensis]